MRDVSTQRRCHRFKMTCVGAFERLLDEVGDEFDVVQVELEVEVELEAECHSIGAHHGRIDHLERLVRRWVERDLSESSPQLLVYDRVGGRIENLGVDHNEDRDTVVEVS